MKLEEQVCSLELSKRLKELGVLQKSLFHHCLISDNVGFEVLLSDSGFRIEEKYSAFTVAELENLLPDEVHDTGDRLILRFDKYTTKYILDVNRNNYRFSQIDTKNSANHRAMMVIFLIENDYIKP